jgi:transposase
MLDGNASDAFANRVQLDKLAQLLPAAHEVTLVGDCKLVDKKTLGWAKRSGFEYVSLLPRTFALRSELIDEARRTAPKMEWLGERAKRLIGEAPRPYHGCAFERTIRVRNETSGEEEDVMHEVIVVHSSSLEAEFDRSLEDRLAKEKSKIEKAARALGRRTFACSADAEAAARLLAEDASFSAIRTTAALVSKPVKRPKRGRPPNGEAPIFTEHWEAVLEGVERDEERIAIARVHASHFTLLSSRVGAKAWGAKRVFEAYRAQQTIEGHTGFRWLKGAANVAPLFLKLPHRIAALGLVFLLALMVRNYIEGTVRTALRQREKTLPDMNDKPTMKPTTEAIFRLFRFAQVIRVFVGETLVARQVHHLPAQLDDILTYLDLPADLFHRRAAENGGGFA